MTSFLSTLNKKVQKFKKTYKLSDGKAFGMWLAVEHFSLDEDEAFEAVSIDGGNDKDIDLFFVDEDAERVVIGQLKFNSTGQYKAKKNELLGLLHATDWLKDAEACRREGRKELENAAVDYNRALSNGYSIEYVYAFCGPDRKDVSDAARQFSVSEAGNLPSRVCKLMGIETLKTVHEESINQSTRVAACELDVSKYLVESGAYGEAIITTLDGGQLRALYDNHGDKLFDRNVRLFLGARKGGVNAGIQATLESTTERKNFWAYNNGVTIICDDFDSSKKGKLKLNNFSIVNGCQTTVTLASAPTNTLQDVRVLVRIIQASEKVIDSVITFNNSQNPIRLWDLNSQDKLQKKLKKQLAALPQPFFYVLRKGEVQKLTEGEKVKFKRDGKIQQIPHDLNAQFLAAFRGLPAIAYKDKGKLFSVHREELFPPQIRPEELVLVWQAGRVVKELVRRELEEAIARDDANRVSILKRGAALFNLAIMALILHERNGQTFLNTIKATVATSKTTVRRLENYATIGLEWYIEIMEDLITAGEEVPTLVRSQAGWLKMKPKILSKWKIYRLSKKAMEEALPKL